jgi:hypothetical protein
VKRAVNFGIFWVLWCVVVLGTSIYILRTPRYQDRTTQIEKTESIMLRHGSTLTSDHVNGFLLSSSSIDGFEWERTSGGDHIPLQSHEDKAIGHVLNYTTVPPGTWRLSTEHDNGFEVQTTVFAVTPVTVTETCQDRDVPCFGLAQTLSKEAMSIVSVLIMGLILALPILLAGFFD